MENLNSVEIKGILGSIRIGELSVGKYARMAISTKHGDDTEWHSVIAWESDRLGCDLSALKDGMNLHIVGRLHNQTYVDKNGIDRAFTEIMAQSIKIIK